MEITLFETRGKIEGGFTAKDFELLKGVPGRSRWLDRVFWFENTAANLEYIQLMLPSARWINKKQLEELELLRRLEQEARERKASVKIEAPENYIFKTEPYKHQLTAISLSRSKEVFGYLMDLGTGKSKAQTDDMAWHYSAGHLDAVLILAPNGVHRQWVREQLPAHFPDNLKYKAWYWDPSKKMDLEITKKSTGYLKILSMNIEALSTERGLSFSEKFLGNFDPKRCMIVLDESSRIKNQKAKRTKSALYLKRFANWRRILSGAPITKGVEDLYSQFLFLDERILGYRSFYSFRNHFCVTQSIPGAPAGAVKIVGYKNLEELSHRIEGHTYRVTKAECLDLPPKIYTTREVDLTPEQRKIYKELRDQFFTQLENGAIVDGALAVTRLVKLQQVLCGFLQYKDEETQENIFQEFPSNRAKDALECIEEAPGKILVWARFHYDLDILSRTLKKEGISFVNYDGRVSADQRTKNLDAFRNDPSIKAMLAQPQAGGIGLNITVADTVLYYSNDFNADTRWQSEDRTHRIGQDKSVNYIDLVVPGTVDTKIMLALRDKKSIADVVLDPSFRKDA